jgi:putative secretion ATPase (PEP-CTERM system associated)
MYTDFFGLREKPFDLLPNPDFLFPSQAHKRAMTYLAHGISQRAGFILLTGEVGSGKTTLIRNLIRSQLKGSIIAKVFNTRVDSLQLLVQINSDFGLETDGRDKASLLRELNDFLIAQYGKRKQSVLIIDEAQNLTAGMLEEVRMLSNLETDRDKLLQIILVGQPELRDTLAQPKLLQLRQRIQISCHLQPLTKDEVREYILFRMEKAGNRDAVTWQDDAIRAIAAYSRGIPRLINILCDYVMVDAFSTQTKTIEGKVVHELATDLSFEAQYWSSKPVVRPAPIQAPEPVQQPGQQRQTASDQGSLNGLSKVMNALAAMNKRLEALEYLPVWDHAALLDLRERLDMLEVMMEKKVKDLWVAHQQLRTELTPKAPPKPENRDEQKKPGTPRDLLKLLWKN